MLPYPSFQPIRYPHDDIQSHYHSQRQKERRFHPEKVIQ